MSSKRAIASSVASKQLPSQAAIEAAITAAERRAASKLSRYFPDTGPYRRELYRKHLQFFAAGATHRTRAFISANRVGKSKAGAFETTLHLTGDYPSWWEGRQFERGGSRLADTLAPTPGRSPFQSFKWRTYPACVLPTVNTTCDELMRVKIVRGLGPRRPACRTMCVSHPPLRSSQAGSQSYGLSRGWLNALAFRRGRLNWAWGFGGTGPEPG
jgi:hypothetical protein